MRGKLEGLRTKNWKLSKWHKITSWVCLLASILVIFVIFSLGGYCCLMGYTTPVLSP